MNIREFPGYHGLHTRDEAPGAFPNGTRVQKVGSNSGDAHQDGALATVLGSVSDPTDGLAYFVEWDSHPRAAVMIVESRCRVVSS